MPPYLLGSPVQIGDPPDYIQVRDVVTKALVDPTSITLTLQKPDLTQVTYSTGSFIHPGLGLYYLQIAASPDLILTGPYQWKLITTGPGAGVWFGGFQMFDPLAPSHVFYQDAKERLNLSSLSDGEVLAMILSAVSEQERSVGAVAPRTVTETITASGGRLWPVARPVLSVTSATLNGVTQVTSGWTVRYDVITPAVGYLSGDYVTQLVAGRNPVPQDLVEAALLRVQHSYATQRGGGAGASRIIGAAVDDVSSGPDGGDFLLMLRALDKEKPYRLVAVA